MSYTDVGKDAKRKGTMHPKHARKTDPEPLRATPKAKPHRRVEKPFGFSYEHLWAWWDKKRAKWERCFEWFETEAARDQSMRSFERKHIDGKYYRDIRAELRR